MAKFWISHCALSKGIFAVDADGPSLVHPGMLVVRGERLPQFYHGEGQQWHRTRDDAVARAEEMRAKRIAALKKQIAKLEKLNFGLLPVGEG